jgi:hypothetical protein
MSFGAIAGDYDRLRPVRRTPRSTGCCQRTAGWRSTSPRALACSRECWRHRPSAEELSACTVPALVLVAANSRQHDITQLTANARRLMPDVVTATLPGVSHHSVPTERAAQLNHELLVFLG